MIERPSPPSPDAVDVDEEALVLPRPSTRAIASSTSRSMVVRHASGCRMTSAPMDASVRASRGTTCRSRSTRRSGRRPGTSKTRNSSPARHALFVRAEREHLPVPADHAPVGSDRRTRCCRSVRRAFSKSDPETIHTPCLRHLQKAPSRRSGQRSCACTVSGPSAASSLKHHHLHPREHAHQPVEPSGRCAGGCRSNAETFSCMPAMAKGFMSVDSSSSFHDCAAAPADTGASLRTTPR